MRNGSRTYLLNIEDPTSPMQSKLRHKAYGEISVKEHKSMKTKITESIWYETMYVIKESYNSTNDIHIENKSISALKNVEERYN